MVIMAELSDNKPGSNDGEDGSDDDRGRDGGSGSEDHGAAMEVMKELDSMEVKLEVMITVLEEVIVKVIVHWWWKCESGVEVENQ